MPALLREAWNELSGYHTRRNPASSTGTARRPAWACIRIATRPTSPRPWFLSRSATPRCFASAACGAAIRPLLFVLSSGDAVVLGGDARLAFHGVDRIVPGSSTLLAEGGRINLTLRRVTVA